MIVGGTGLLPGPIGGRGRSSDTEIVRSVGASSLGPCDVPDDRSTQTESAEGGGEFLPAGCSDPVPSQLEQQLAGSLPGSVAEF